MYKLIVIILIICLNSIQSQCQNAKEILERLAETTNSYKNITINFDFISNINIDEVESGSLTMQENKFIIDMFDQTIINNGETQWIHLREVNEVQIMDNNTESEVFNPKKILTVYEDDFKYEYVDNKLENGKKLHIINLFPKQNREFIKINVEIDDKKNQLKRISIYDKSNGIYTYIIKSFKSNTSIKPFKFDASEFPDIEVIDLR